jgi:hypothetical protein
LVVDEDLFDGQVEQTAELEGQRQTWRVFSRLKRDYRLTGDADVVCKVGLRPVPLGA